jgi:hypothetical protein
MMKHRQAFKIEMKYPILLQLLFVLVPLTQSMLYATGGTMTGSGTITDPFLVADYADLKVVGTTTTYSLSAVYRLTSDINASASQTENSGAGFVPIGVSYGGAFNFAGTFHGAGHVIKNLYINRPGSSFIGLFGCAWSPAIIDSLGVIDADITGVQFVGGVVGNSDAIITNCYSTGHVAGSYAQVGGVVGDNAGQISNCYSTVNVTGGSDVGGVVGENGGQVSRGYSTGHVTGNDAVGGVVGVNSIGSIANCYATGSITGSANGVNGIGGVAGLNSNSGTVSNCYAIGNVTGVNYVGGVVGEIYDSATISNCYWNTQTTGMSSGYGNIIHGGTFSGSGLSTAEMHQLSSFSGWDFSTVWSMNSSINNGYPYFTSNMPTSVEGRTIVTPKAFSLLQNYPDPFNPSTNISFSIPAASFISLKVFDALGREVSVVLSEELPAGKYSRQWNAAGLPSGVYFYRLQAGSFAETKKLVLLR